MNIRRDRSHQCGLTNVDYRTKRDASMLGKYQQDYRHKDLGTMSRTQYGQSIFESTANLTNA